MSKQTSRRAILFSAAAIGIAPALPALADADAATDRALAELEAKLTVAWDELGSVLQVVGDADEAMFAWQGRNPEPRMGQGETQAELRASQLKYERELKNWRARERVAKRESGHDRAEELENEMHDKIAALVDQMCSIRAQSMRGLACKARVTHMNAKLPNSILSDLLSLERAA